MEKKIIMSRLKPLCWGGTKIVFIEIVTLETGDMPQKVLFGPIAEAPCQKKKIENYIFKNAMGSCIKVVKQKKLVSV
jgi:hypothetical protein